MILDPILDYFRGKAVTVPPMDGAFRPNTALDDAELIAEFSAPDDMAVLDDALLIASGNGVWRIAAGEKPTLFKSFLAPITALAASSSEGVIVGLETGKLFIDGAEIALPAEIKCITALATTFDGLFLANGSRDYSPSRWSRDLMSHGQSGSIWFMDWKTKAFRKVADGLAYPSGLDILGDVLVVSESWKRRLIRIDIKTGAQSTVLDKLPGYPGRLSPGVYGGFVLCIFAPMNRLIEFVLQEEDYRKAMLAEVAEEHWIAPALSSARSFLEPMQCGAIRSMGVHKAWSPTRSYGLVVTLDSNYQPVTSFHSRANGVRHGVTSAIPLKDDGKLYIASKGGDCLVALDLKGRA